MFAFRYSERLGLGYQLFLTCNSGSLMCSFVLFLCYSVSTETFLRVRPTLFVSICEWKPNQNLTWISIAGSVIKLALLWSLHCIRGIADVHSVLRALLHLPHLHRLHRLPSPHSSLCGGLCCWAHSSCRCYTGICGMEEVLLTAKLLCFTKIYIFSLFM